MNCNDCPLTGVLQNLYDRAKELDRIMWVATAIGHRGERGIEANRESTKSHRLISYIEEITEIIDDTIAEISRATNEKRLLTSPERGHAEPENWEKQLLYHMRTPPKIQ